MKATRFENVENEPLLGGTMKYSSYNIFIELSDGDLLLVNTFSGAMFKVSEETRRKITEDRKSVV